MESLDKLLRIRGHVAIELGGQVVREMSNLYVNVGYQRLAAYLAGQGTANPGYIAVGNGDGSVGGLAVTPAAADTKLGFELLRIPVSAVGLTGTATIRYYTQFASTQVPQALTEVGLFDSAGLTSQVTSAMSTTITDITQNWKTNQWANWYVYLVNGTGVGQQVQILSNTATVLMLSAALSPVPDATTTYTIGGPGSNGFMYAHAAISPTITKTLQPMNVIWTLSLPQF